MRSVFPPYACCYLTARPTHRRDKRLAARLRYARLRQHAVVEDVDYRALFQKLANGEWIDAHDNLILCGPPAQLPGISGDQHGPEQMRQPLRQLLPRSRRHRRPQSRGQDQWPIRQPRLERQDQL
jgi:hypothetical protein